MRKGFYRAFEEKHRGSRELIKSRLRVYLPFVAPLLDLHEEGKAIDLGCGRGEWLELLDEAGFETYGVDLDAGMLAGCQERGLNVVVKDAIEALKELPDESQVVVSGFHIVEHIPFPSLQVLVQEALRVLKPAGLLIMETPNPENIIVGSSSFYLDPTHERPIPKQLLSFLPEYYGYGRVKILLLQGNPNTATIEQIGIMDVLGGVSPDYAVVAQKSAHTEVLEITSAAFEKDYGLNLVTVATRYDQITAGSIARAELAAQSAESRAQQTGAALYGVYNSRSWRLTAPLRWISKTAKWFVWNSLAWLTFAPMSRPRRMARQVVLHLRSYVAARPRLKVLALRFLVVFPNLLARLRRIGSPLLSLPRPFSDGGPEQLSPHGRQIYADLKAAIEQRRKEGRADAHRY